jgi:membrane protease YdiL (CAAX protease family)
VTDSRRRIAVEVLCAFAVATAAAALFYRLPAIDRVVSGGSHALIAATFLYVPAYLLRRKNLGDYGLRFAPVGEGFALLALAVAIVFPLFAVGFAAWQRIACALPALGGLAPGPCGGARSLALRLPPGFVRLVAAEIVVVALPEECFFRGYLQGRLEELWPSRRRLLGAPVGAALVVAAALFALCHLLVQGNAATLAVFFPGLVFGWMRARTGSIFAGTLFHALCNVFMETLHRSLFGFG